VQGVHGVHGVHGVPPVIKVESFDPAQFK
jgi:hypothetical protein